MTQRFLSRRLLVGGTSAALLVGAVGFIPLLGSASAAGCPAWTDPAGDATTGQAPDPSGVLIHDDQMDIVGASFTTTATTLTATFRVTKLGDTASDFGDEFHMNFTAGGKDLQIYSDRPASEGDPLTAPVGKDAGFTDVTDNKSASGKAAATYDLAKNTVTITGSLADLATLAAVPLSGKPVTKLVAETQDYLTGANSGFLYDDAATTLPATLGVDCAGAPAPGPTGSTTASPAPSPSPTASTPPPASTGDPAKDLQKPGCVTQADAKGDSKFAGNGPNDPDIDLTGLIMRTTPTELVGYLTVDKLAAGPSTTDGHRFTLGFTFNKHNFAAAGSSYKNGSGPIKDGLAGSGQFSHVTQLSVDGGGSVVPDPTNPTADKGFKTSGLKVTFDIAHSRVVFELPVADITKYDGGVPFTGDLTAVLGTAATDNWASSSPADYVSKDNTSTSTVKWTIGDNACFAPPPGVLANAGATKSQYGDPAVVATKLTDSKGAVLAGRSVTFTLAGRTATATTGSDGVARATILMSMTAGPTSLGESFAGDASADKVSLAVPFTVVQEKTKVLLSVTKKGTARTVAITLLDDDNHAVAGQKVAVYVNGKLVSTLTTNAAGKVSFTKANPSQTVKVVFAPVAGKYLGSTAQLKV